MLKDKIYTFFPILEHSHLSLFLTIGLIAESSPQSLFFDS